MQTIIEKHANRKKYHRNKGKVQNLTAKKQEFLLQIHEETGSTSILHTSRITLPCTDFKRHKQTSESIRGKIHLN